MRLTRTHTRWEWEGIRLDCLSVELEPGCGGEISFFIPLECFNHQSDESHMAGSEQDPGKFLPRLELFVDKDDCGSVFRANVHLSIPGTANFNLLI